MALVESERQPIHISFALPHNNGQWISYPTHPQFGRILFFSSPERISYLHLLPDLSIGIVGYRDVPWKVHIQQEMEDQTYNDPRRITTYFVTERDGMTLFSTAQHNGCKISPSWMDHRDGRIVIPETNRFIPEQTQLTAFPHLKIKPHLKIVR